MIIIFIFFSLRIWILWAMYTTRWEHPLPYDISGNRRSGISGQFVLSSAISSGASYWNQSLYSITKSWHDIWISFRLHAFSPTRSYEEAFEDLGSRTEAVPVCDQRPREAPHQQEDYRRLRKIRLFLPREFERRSVSLDHLGTWKAQEYRTFLLYTGTLKAKKIYFLFIEYNTNIKKYFYWDHFFWRVF